MAVIIAAAVDVAVVVAADVAAWGDAADLKVGDVGPGKQVGREGSTKRAPQVEC